MKRIKQHIVITLTVIVLLGCENIFEFSPFEARVNIRDRNQTTINLNKLTSDNTNAEESFSFITMSDTHSDYADLDRAITRINSLENIDFVFHLGDMADRGWLKEFELFSESMKRLNIPFFTSIGNHDYLANGEEIYSQMFGVYNYTINYKQVKLIVFDATTWESDKLPDVDWLSQQLETSSSMSKIILSHIPFYDRQVSQTHQSFIKESIEANNVILTLHGHYHRFEEGYLWNTEVQYKIQGNISKNELYKIDVKDGRVNKVELIEF